MLVSFDIVKREYCPISWRQLGDSLVQCYAIDNRHCIGIFRTLYYLNWRFTILSRLLHTNPALAEVHEHLIDCQPVEPGSKGRFTPKTSNLSKELYEDLLSEIFSLRDIPRHP